MSQRELAIVSEEECYALVSGVNVGRLLYVDDIGPIGVPVNYALSGRDIIFRSEGGTKKAAMEQPLVGFEIDHISDDRHSGWSVILRGHLDEVDMDDVPALIRSMEGHFPAPWAVGVHNQWMRLTPTVVTGRKLGKEGSMPIV